MNTSSPLSPRRGCRRPLAAGRGRRGLRTAVWLAVHNPARSCTGNWPQWPGHGGSRSSPMGNCCPPAAGAAGTASPGAVDCAGAMDALESPPALFAGRGDETRSPVLVRSDCMEEASLLLTQFHLWVAYAVEAPQVRLDRWRFAVAADGRVAVTGQTAAAVAGPALGRA